MNKELLKISLANIKTFDDAYVYGSYTSMSWLKGKILELKKAIEEDALVSIEGCGVIASPTDLFSWVEKKDPELGEAL